MGRPLLPIDGAIVRKLAARFMSGREIATILGCDESVIRDRFPAELAFGRECGKKRLRSKQIELALKGNVAMLIFLGKQYLGQTDKAVIETTERPFDPVEAYSKDPELMQEALELERKAYAASQIVDPGNARPTDVSGVGVSDAPGEARSIRDGSAVEPDGEQGDRADPGQTR
jgi:hypothetical protein